MLSGTCEVIEVEVCSEYLPYTTTKLPNLLGDTTQQKAERSNKFNFNSVASIEKTAC